MACTVCVKIKLAEIYDGGQGEVILYNAANGTLSEDDANRIADIMNELCSECSKERIKRLFGSQEVPLPCLHCGNQNGFSEECYKDQGVAKFGCTKCENYVVVDMFGSRDDMIKKWNQSNTPLPEINCRT